MLNSGDVDRLLWPNMTCIYWLLRAMKRELDVSPDRYISGGVDGGVWWERIGDTAKWKRINRGGWRKRTHSSTLWEHRNSTPRPGPRRNTCARHTDGWIVWVGKEGEGAWGVEGDVMRWLFLGGMQDIVCELICGLGVDRRSVVIW
jgi:hypothetical protein